MSNYSNKLSFHRFTLDYSDTDTMVKSLTEVIKGLDLDFNEVAEQVADEIVTQNDNIEDMLDYLFTFKHDDTQFITCSSTCQEYQYTLVKSDDSEYTLILAMIV